METIEGIQTHHCAEGCSVHNEAWQRVRDALAQAKAVYYDGCCGINVAMDDGQVAEFRAIGAQPYEREPDFDLVRGWYDQSCEMRRVTAFRTAAGPDGRAVSKQEYLIETGELQIDVWIEDGEDPDEG